MLPNIRKILYATDLSNNSVSAFPLAVDLAKSHDATIVILHAIEPLPSITRMHGDRKTEKEYYDKETEMTRQAIKARIDRMCQKLEESIDFQCASLVSKVLTPVGNPVEEILVNADEEECDIIVMGTHGKGFLKNTFLGSVSRLVLYKTRKPVVVVPLPPQEARLNLEEA